MQSHSTFRYSQRASRSTHDVASLESVRTTFASVRVFQSMVSSLAVDQPEDPIAYLLLLLQDSSVHGQAPRCTHTHTHARVQRQLSQVCVKLLNSRWRCYTKLSCSLCSLSLCVRTHARTHALASVPRVVLMGPPAVGKTTLVS